MPWSDLKCVYTQQINIWFACRFTFRSTFIRVVTLRCGRADSNMWVHQRVI